MRRWVTILVSFLVIIGVIWGASILYKQINARKTSIKYECIDEDPLLKEADRNAEYLIEKAFWEGEGCFLDVGITVTPALEPDYVDIITQLHDKDISESQIYKWFDPKSGRSIEYILQHYDEWRKMKGLK